MPVQTQWTLMPMQIEIPQPGRRTQLSLVWKIMELSAYQQECLSSKCHEQCILQTACSLDTRFSTGPHSCEATFTLTHPRAGTLWFRRRLLAQPFRTPAFDRNRVQPTSGLIDTPNRGHIGPNLRRSDVRMITARPIQWGKVGVSRFFRVSHSPTCRLAPNACRR